MNGYQRMQLQAAMEQSIAWLLKARMDSAHAEADWYDTPPPAGARSLAERMQGLAAIAAEAAIGWTAIAADRAIEEGEFRLAEELLALHRLKSGEEL